MLELCLLGTGGTMPLPERGLTALMVKYGGKSLLIDCGEGTQVAIRKKKWSMKSIDIIAFTHFHADHMCGLPGMLLSMGKDGRREPVLLIGPKGLTQMVNCLRAVAPELPYEVECVEIEGEEQTFHLGDLRIEAFQVDHSILCYGYSMNVDRAPRFLPEKARVLGLEPRYWGRLQKGETIETNGAVYTPDMVMGEARRGIHLTYITDTRPTESMRRFAADSDLLICEGMYGEPEKLEKAIENQHMMFTEAASLARDVQAKELWLTHYSPSMDKPEEYMEPVRKIFPNAIAPEDLRSADLNFTE